jgi:predicted nucleotidyltransferase
MASKTNITKLLKNFITLLKKENVIKIKSAYLFGSVLTGKNTKYSDIDLAIISDSFTGSRYDDRAKLNPYISRINCSIEVHPFKSNEFKNDNPFAREIIQNGKKIL